VTIFGWDISDYDVDRGLTASEVRNGYSQGIRFFTAKSTETAPGAVYTHTRALALLRVARDVYPYYGHYVVPRSGVKISTQGQNCLRVLDQHVPGWRTDPKFFHQVDLEFWGYDNVPLQVGVQLCDWLKANTGKPVVLYASGGHYGNGKVSDYPRWNPNYWLWQRVGDFRDLYRDSGGDSGAGWKPAGTVIWQYSDSAIIAGQRSCDANAFKGSVEDFGRMLGVKTAEKPAEDTSGKLPVPLIAALITSKGE
jgi:hypothetical protein